MKLQPDTWTEWDTYWRRFKTKRDRDKALADLIKKQQNAMGIYKDILGKYEYKEGEIDGAVESKKESNI